MDSGMHGTGHTLGEFRFGIPVELQVHTKSNDDDGGQRLFGQLLMKVTFGNHARESELSNSCDQGVRAGCWRRFSKFGAYSSGMRNRCWCH